MPPGPWQRCTSAFWRLVAKWIPSGNPVKALFAFIPSGNWETRNFEYAMGLPVLGFPWSASSVIGLPGAGFPLCYKHLWQLSIWSSFSTLKEYCWRMGLLFWVSRDQRCLCSGCPELLSLRNYLKEFSRKNILQVVSFFFCTMLLWCCVR